MNNTILAFILSTLSGLSTFLGAFFILKIKKKSNNIIICSLAFASGVMFFLSTTDLLKESYFYLKNTFYSFPSIIISLIFVILGIIISMFIDKKFPNDVLVLKKDKNLYKVGLISMLAIIIHNIPEGIATFISTTTDINLGISLSISIAMHNIPEGISIAMPIYYSTNDKLKALSLTLISSLSEIFGSIIAFFLARFLNTSIFMGIIFSLIAGIMIHISLYELLPTSLKYNKKKLTLIFFFIGMFFVLINIFLL